MSDYLEIESLTKRFGAFVALEDITLSIRQGEFVCFLGPSGCGKTTLLRAIAGLDLQSSGRIRQDGRDISALPPAARDFGIVFQSYALFPNLTIARNVAFGLESTRASRERVDARVAELLELVGLPEQVDKYPSQLSGGQQQRVALARALAMSPGLLLLDEPLSALDARVRVNLRAEIKELQRRLGVTTIMVTHDQEEALVMADRIVVMNHGVVEQIGTPTEIYREPASLFAANFIGQMNRLPARVGADTGVVHVGGLRLDCAPHRLSTDGEAIAAIRPEDLVPHALAGDERGAGEAVSEPGNTIDVAIEEMHFLGSFWRTRLVAEAMGAERLSADFSVNAVRRLELESGKRLRVEIPSERLKVFETDASAP